MALKYGEVICVCLRHVFTPHPRCGRCRTAAREQKALDKMIREWRKGKNT